jgi:hypothetical protein
MSFLKKGGIILISIISVFLLILLSLSFTLNSFLYPDIYFKAFESGGFYTYLEENLQNSGTSTFIDFSGGVKPTVNKLFSNLLAYVRSDVDVLDLTIKVDQEKLRNFFLDSLGELKQCTTSQNPYNQNNPCLPKGQSKEQFLDNFLRENNLPFFQSDTVDLAYVYGIEEGSASRENIDNLRRYIKYYSSLKFILIILILICLALIYLLEKPSINKFFRVSGLNFIISSLFLFMAVFSLKNAQLPFSLDDQFTSAIISTVKTVLTSKLLIYSIIIGIIGLISFISSFFVKSNLTVRKL